MCRFCRRAAPEVTFKLEAHAIPECLGNHSLLTHYECDTCNGVFGRSIENDLGNWSKPSRTFSRVRGKSGVPVLKKGGEHGWRIEWGADGLEVSHERDDPLIQVFEDARQIRFTLKRDVYTPIAVLKAFVKIGLSLFPESEMPNFEEALKWVRDPDHACFPGYTLPVIRTYIQGPITEGLITAWALRRKAGVRDAPYAVLVLLYGNEQFQVAIPSLARDNVVTHVALPSFPAPRRPDRELDDNDIGLIDLSSAVPVRDGTVTVTVGYEERNRVVHF